MAQNRSLPLRMASAQSMLVMRTSLNEINIAPRPLVAYYLKFRSRVFLTLAKTTRRTK